MPDKGEETQEETTEEETSEEETQDDTDTEPDWKAEAKKWKGFARKHESQAKANAHAAKKLKEAEDADKTEAQKAADRATEAEKRATDAELKALRLEVAADKNLSPAQAKRLVGTTKEELEADADELVESFTPTDSKGKPTGKPKEDLRGGGDPTEEPEETDPRKIVKGIPRDTF